MVGELPSSRTKFRVFKVKPGSDMACLSRVKDVMGFHVHWLGKRSYMCPGAECVACEEMVGSRWNGLLGVDVTIDGNGTTRFGLIELSESSYSRLMFVKECEGFKDLFGLRFNVGRQKKRSPIIFTQSADCTVLISNIAEVVDTVIGDACSTLYGLPSVMKGETVSEWSERSSHAARMLISRAVQLLRV